MPGDRLIPLDQVLAPPSRHANDYSGPCPADGGMHPRCHHERSERWDLAVAPLLTVQDGVRASDELIASIREHGIRERIVIEVRRGNAYIIAGMHRLDAARRIGFDTVPGYVVWR